MEGFKEGTVTDLGTYVAQTKHYEARMDVRARILGVGMSNPIGSDHYEVNFTFCNDGGLAHLDQGNLVANVRFGISTPNFPGIFRRIKKCEEGIEEALDDTRHHPTDWRGQREVMKLIFSLEQQTEEPLAERKRIRDEAYEKAKRR